MLNTLSLMINAEAMECKNWLGTAAQALKAYYHQLDASGFNFNEALEALVTLTKCSQKTGHAEQQEDIFRA